MPSDKYNVMPPAKGDEPEEKLHTRQLFAERTQAGQKTPACTSWPQSPGQACPPRALAGLPLNGPGNRAGVTVRGEDTGSGPLRAGGGLVSSLPHTADEQRREDAYRRAIADALRSDPGVLLKGEIRFPDEIEEAPHAVR